MIWFVDVFFTIVRCFSVVDYMFIRDSQLVKWLDCNRGNLQRIVCFYYSCKIEQPDAMKHNGMTNFKWKGVLWIIIYLSYVIICHMCACAV